MALIVGLCAARSFRPPEVSDTDIRPILEAGGWTGSTRQPPALALHRGCPGGLEAGVEHRGPYAGHLAHVPVVILIAADPETIGAEVCFDQGWACQNLARAAAGLGSCPAPAAAPGPGGRISREG